jgi:RND family efflux transporter MFP subunit
LLAITLGGCNTHDHAEQGHGHEHAPGNIAVTLWTDRTELFMEYPTLLVNQDATFVIHFSKMDDFKAVTTGKLTAIFRKTDGTEVRVSADAPSRPGIFLPVVRFAQAGVYGLELQLNSPQVEDVVQVADVRVYASEKDMPHAEEESGGDQISFLKEQQWKIDFRTEPTGQHRLFASIRAVGEILPKIQAHAEVPALVNGMILPDQNAHIPSVGTWVKKGQVLAVVSPPAHTDAGLNRMRKDYLLAKGEYERAQRLFDKQAISKKRLEEAKLIYEAQKASFDVIEQQVDFESLNGNGELHFHVKAPIAGILEEIHFHSGEAVDVGQKLFTITNPERVWLKAQVPLSQVARLKNAQDASFTVEGYDREFSVSELNGKLISVGSIADRTSRTVPVIFELDNPEQQLKIHMFATVSVKTQEALDALAIPISAVYDDNGIPVVYVQVEGETFERRVLKVGITDREYVQVIEGIEPGERVVTEGGYQVRLASLSTSVPTGHGHAH